MSAVSGTGNQTRDSRTAAPFEGLPGSSASVWTAAPDPQPYRDGKQEERWRKVQEKLDRGDLKGVEKELERILDRSPDDSEARDLLERVRASREHGPGRRGEDD